MGHGLSRLKSIGNAFSAHKKLVEHISWLIYDHFDCASDASHIIYFEK